MDKVKIKQNMEVALEEVISGTEKIADMLDKLITDARKQSNLPRSS